MKQSAIGKLNKEDLIKIGKGLLIAIGGATLIIIGEAIPGIDFGVYTPLAVAISSVLVNTGIKLKSGN